MKNYPACKEVTIWGLVYCLQSSLLIVYVVLLLSDCYDIILLYYFIVRKVIRLLFMYLFVKLFVIYCEKWNFTFWNVAFQRIQDFLEVFFMFFQYKMRYLVVGKKKNPLFLWGWDRKIRPSQSQFVITRQASWCQTEPRDRLFYPTLILMMDSYNKTYFPMQLILVDFSYFY